MRVLPITYANLQRRNDGNRRKKVQNETTTIYVGEHYEKNISTGAITKYYYFGGKRIAMRVGTTLTYLHSDHLGSASLATNTSGGIVWQARYKPFGETRWTSGALTTNRKPSLNAANGFNGMKEVSALGGIYDFNARYGVYPERSEGTPRSGGS